MPSIDPIGKATGNCQALTAWPFYAMNISSDNPFNPIGAITLGGLDVEETIGEEDLREMVAIGPSQKR